MSKKTPQQKRASVQGEAAPPPLSKSFPVVGIGASAGCLNAFPKLHKERPVDTGKPYAIALTERKST